MRSLAVLIVLVCAPLAAAADDVSPERAACTAAMNKDPQFALDIIDLANTKVKPDVLQKYCETALVRDPAYAAELAEHAADKARAERREQQDLEAHDEAARHIATNERHVIIAYIAMWLVAVGFVLFLARRQAALRREIALLRRDLEAATKESA